uniref:Transcription initiation factor TFIID subunit 6 n=1 Tax=Plectus sambesii TaxID=2011161 RepID=A0A914XJH5_9BILA
MAEEETESILPALDVNYIKVVSEAVGISHLPEDAASLVAEEVSFRLKELVQQANKFTLHGRRRKLIADDIDKALRSKNVEPLFGFSSKDGLPFRYAGSHGRDIYLVDDKDVDLVHIINSNAPKAPLEVQLKAHWLAIEGEQPAVPENPVALSLEEAPLTGKDTAAGPSHVKAIRKTEQVQVKASTIHSLSVEQQVFYKEVTEACVGADEGRRAEALHSLATDAGLQPLLPRFAVAIAEGVRCNVVQHNLAILIYLMRMTQSLVNNPAVSLDRVLHELLPSILSCVLSRQLCARPDVDNHWALREFASRLLAQICKTYNDDISNVRARVTQTLTSSWRDASSSLASLYGALYSLTELGTETLHSVIVPRVATLFDDIRRAFVDRNNPGERLAAEKLQALVLKALTSYVRTSRPAGLRDIHDYRAAFGGFGDSVMKQTAEVVQQQQQQQQQQAVQQPRHLPSHTSGSSQPHGHQYGRFR